MKQLKQNIAIKDRYLSYLFDIFETDIGKIPAKIILYGSRSNGCFYSTSDIDLAVESTQLTSIMLANIREGLHESHIPYKIDIVNFHEVSKELQSDIKSEGKIIWEN